MVIDAGHEIGIHGYTHENPLAMTREQEEAILDRTFDVINGGGKPPVGYMAPWWELSPITNELLLERGIKYDHSLMRGDFQPYYLRVGDSWTKIDYSKKASEWMKPSGRQGGRPGRDPGGLAPGRPAADDVRQSLPEQPRLDHPRELEEMWKDQFDWVYRDSTTPSSRSRSIPTAAEPHVLLMHERIIEHINKHDGVRWATFDEIADDFASGARAPADGYYGLTSVSRSDVV